jgi:hypothetical protein
VLGSRKRYTDKGKRILGQLAGKGRSASSSIDAGVCTPSLSSPLSMASLLEYFRCRPHCLRNLFASSVQLLTYETLLFINNRIVSIPVSVIALAITWAYRCEYGVQLSLQYNLPRIRLWYPMVSHTHHTILFTIKRNGLWGQKFRLPHVHIYRKELTTLCLPASISTERKRELTVGWRFVAQHGQLPMLYMNGQPEGP